MSTAQWALVVLTVIAVSLPKKIAMELTRATAQLVMALIAEKLQVERVALGRIVVFYRLVIAQNQGEFIKAMIPLAKATHAEAAVLLEPVAFLEVHAQ